MTLLGQKKTERKAKNLEMMGLTLSLSECLID